MFDRIPAATIAPTPVQRHHDKGAWWCDFKPWRGAGKAAVEKFLPDAVSLLGVGQGHHLWADRGLILDQLIPSAMGVNPGGRACGIFADALRQMTTGAKRGAQPAFLWTSSASYSADAQAEASGGVITHEDGGSDVLVPSARTTGLPGPDTPDQPLRIRFGPGDQLGLHIPYDAIAFPERDSKVPVVVRWLHQQHVNVSTGQMAEAQQWGFGKCPATQVAGLFEGGFFPSQNNGVICYDNGTPAISDHPFLLIGRIVPAIQTIGGRLDAGGGNIDFNVHIVMFGADPHTDQISFVGAKVMSLDAFLISNRQIVESVTASLRLDNKPGGSVPPGKMLSGSAGTGKLALLRHFMADSMLGPAEELSYNAARRSAGSIRRRGPEALEKDEASASKHLKKTFDADTRQSVNINAAARAAELRDELIPPISEDQRRRLLGAIRIAQLDPPEGYESKLRLTEDLNKILDAHELRLQADGKGAFRLRVVPGSTGRGFFQFSGGPKRARSGFKAASIQLVEVPSNFVGNKHRRSDTVFRTARATGKASPEPLIELGAGNSPQATPEQIRSLEAMILAAQDKPPADLDGKQAFIRGVNHLLEDLSLRLLVDGELYRLKVSASSSRHGTIQFSKTGGSTGGFSGKHRKRITVIPVEDHGLAKGRSRLAPAP